MAIPSTVRALLWEYDQDALARLDELPDAVLERVMARGGWDEIRWLLSAVERERLRSYLADRGCRVLPARELAFWAVACDIPESTACEWRRAARDQERAWRG